ncbi:MAG: aminotransferase class I/II-fold pyridoxal phosphate-dependent enzyme [Bacteroidota bacterium]|nr:aminotransferase class I/II-fold pyridoxal phosphate-dependent enzyme [Bacteroidota bacterium]
MEEVRHLQNQGTNIINLGIGSPDLPPHPEVIKILNQSSKEPENNGYQPYSGLKELRNAFSNWYKNIYHVNLNPDKQILPLMGSKEGIMHISMAFCNPGDRVLIPNPGYPAYTAAAKLLNLDIQYYHLSEENGWLPDFDQLEKLYNDQCKIIWINYPHMPTGKVASKNQFKKIVGWAKYRNILIVNDNPYSLILNDKPVSILSFLNDYSDIIELNSLSKSHNMAGWRVGMLGTSEENMKYILKVKTNFDSGMFKPIQLAAAKALSLTRNWYNTINKEYSERRKLVWAILDQLECRYSKNSAGLFVWAKIPNSFSNCYEFSDYLLYTLGIFAAPGHIFGNNGHKYIRFSLCASQNSLHQTINRVKELKNILLCE